MAASGTTTLQLIQQKKDSLSDIMSMISTITANPKPSYEINGKSISWGEYLAVLQSNQYTESLAPENLYKIANMDNPYWFQSRGV